MLLILKISTGAYYPEYTVYMCRPSVSPDTVSFLNVSTRFYLGVHAVRNLATTVYGQLVALGERKFRRGHLRVTIQTSGTVPAAPGPAASASEQSEEVGHDSSKSCDYV